MRQWRLIYDYPTVGVQNMAIDEAILMIGERVPTLRFYAWSPPCLSLGYAQKTADVDFERVAAMGWDVVRRPTGGRAILHADELTYSLMLPDGDPIASGGIIESYRRISGALIAGLQSLGIQSQADRRAERENPHGPVCFDTPSHYEITVGGRKLIGSAQMRRKEGVLQHGSLPLWGDIGRICAALNYPDENSRKQGKAQVRARAATLGDVLKDVSWEDAAAAITSGFRETFDVEFVAVELSDAEYHYAAQLAAEKYASPEWTFLR
jgi:lipoate-protein ligase A